MDNLPSKHYVRQTPYSLRPYAISQAEFLSDRPAIRRILSSAIVFHPASASSPLRTLLLRRAPTDYFPLLWETPGGSVDEDDLSIIEAAKREVKEEAGLAVKTAICCVPIPEGSHLPSASSSSLVENGDVKWEDVYKFEDNGAAVTFPEPGTDWSWAKITFLMEVEGDGEVVLQPEEHVDYRWVTEEEVAEGRFKARDGQGEEEEGIEFVSEVVRAAVLEGFRIKKEVLRVQEENRDESEN
ncbi:NUDIX domain-containing protein [Sarocladium implicatum]|nr:NUDIX domain-containing protein [Sarocladium implicatum]